MNNDLWRDPLGTWEYLYYIEKNHLPENQIHILEILYFSYPDKEEIKKTLPSFVKDVLKKSTTHLKFFKYHLIKLWKKKLATLLDKKSCFFEKIFLYTLFQIPDRDFLSTSFFYHLFYWIDFDWKENYGSPLVGLTYYKFGQNPVIKEWDSLIHNVKKQNNKNIEIENQIELIFYSILKNVEVMLPQPIKIIVDKFLNAFKVSSLEVIRFLTFNDPPFQRAKEGKKIKYKDVVYRKLNIEDDYI